jgi:hypothetical protein
MHRSCRCHNPVLNITLHYITVHYSTLHYITLHYVALHCIALHCIAVHYITLCYLTLHDIISHHITLYYLHYITLHVWSGHPHPITLHCYFCEYVILNCAGEHVVRPQRKDVSRKLCCLADWQIYYKDPSS